MYRAGHTHPDLGAGGGHVFVSSEEHKHVADVPAVSLMVKLPTGSLPPGYKPDASSSSENPNTTPSLGFASS